MKKFPDNFPNIFIHNAEMLRFVHCAFICNMVSPETIFEEISIIMMLPRYGVKSLKIILPYFATGTMERIEKQGEVPTAFTLAQMLSLCPLTQHGPAQLITLDIHTLQNQFYFGPNLTVLLMTAIPLLVKTLQREKQQQDRERRQTRSHIQHASSFSLPGSPSPLYPFRKPPLPPATHSRDSVVEDPPVLASSLADAASSHFEPMVGVLSPVPAAVAAEVTGDDLKFTQDTEENEVGKEDNHASILAANASSILETSLQKAMLSPAAFTISSSCNSLDRSIDIPWSAGQHANPAAPDRENKAKLVADAVREDCVRNADEVEIADRMSLNEREFSSADLESTYPDDVAIVFPDMGAAKRYANHFPMFPHVVCSKKRDGDIRKVAIVEGECAGKRCIVVDDLVHSGGTLLSAMELLKQAGAARVDGFATHGVFEKDSWKKFVTAHENGLLHTFYVCNTHPQAMELANVAPFKILCISDTLLPLIVREKKYQQYGHNPSSPRREARSDYGNLHYAFGL